MLPRSGEPTNFINGTVVGEVLVGTDQNDQIRTSGTKPGSGDTYMYGGLGDDTYITLSSSRDRIYENPGEGIDTVMTEWFYALPANVENLILTGTLSVSATGNSLDNVIIGNSGKNIIEGLGGADEMWGGAGNDMFVLQGNDTIMDFSAGDYFDLRGFNGITTFAQLQASMQQVGADTVLTLTPNDVVTIKNTLVSDFEANDFVLSNWKDGYTLTFEDNFDTLSLYTEYGQEGTWYPLYPRTGISAHSTPAKGSVQYFTYMGDMGSVGELVGIDPFKVENGIVSLEMAPIPQDQQYKTYGLDYSAGMLNTIGSFSQTYGYFEARIKFAPGMGIHDAFWMLPIDGSGAFEIDVAEQRGSEPNNVSTVTHAIDDGRDISHSKGFTIPTATTEFHTYGVDWQPNYITFYIDGVAVRTQPTFPGLDVPMYLLASIGGGGLYAGVPDATTPFPAKFEVDYIRAWASASTVEKGVPVDKMGTAGDDVLYGTSLGDTLNGGLGDDKLYGGAGDDILTGGGGNEDRLDGGFGNDTYLVYAASDKPMEGGGREKGIDTVKTTLSQYTLGINLENLTYIGDGWFSGAGNNEDNYIRGGNAGGTLSGGAGSDILEGGDGDDRLHGGAGDDAGIGGRGADDIRGGDGNDRLYGNEGDDLLKGDDGNDLLFGGSGFDSLYGGAGDDVLDGGPGKDRMIGGTGNDIYFVDQHSDWIAEYGGEGIDTIYTALSRYVVDDYVENFVFTGEGSVDITGNFSANRFTASAFGDTMRGGLGDDIYEVNHADDLVIELAGEGNDTVETSLLNYVLPANVENVIYLGTGRFTGTGNELANMLVGSSNADRLDGKAGADVLQGGAGNDTYVVDDEGDVVIEETGGGNDRVLSQVSYTLSDHVETLQLSTSKAINATGNAQNNTLIGNGGANVLDGRGGIDTLTGGGGDDTFLFRIGEADSDVVTDFTGAGMAGGDILRFIGYGAGATIEQVGSSDYYHIKASAAMGGGVELIRLIGATNLSAGDYVFGSGDVVVEPPVDDGEDVSTFLSSYTLGDGQKNLTYLGTDKFTGTGNSEANTIIGGSNADRLDGKGGADVLQGGAGNDTYVADNEGDVVIEEAGGGNDRVLSQVSYTLSDHVETLQLTTSKAINGTGNALANSLVGNNGANVLDGRGGADTLQGGGGNDVFVFQLGEGAGDTVLDFEGAGAPGGDVLHFLGYGAGATITQIGASDYYSINASADLGGGSEMIRLVGVTSLSADDYFFF